MGRLTNIGKAMTDLEKMLAIPHRGEGTLNWAQDGGGLVHRVWGVWVLFEVPLYGGEPHYEGTYRRENLQEMIDKANSWT